MVKPTCALTVAEIPKDKLASGSNFLKEIKCELINNINVPLKQIDPLQPFERLRIVFYNETDAALARSLLTSKVIDGLCLDKIYYVGVHDAKRDSQPNTLKDLTDFKPQVHKSNSDSSTSKTTADTAEDSNNQAKKDRESVSINNDNMNVDSGGNNIDGIETIEYTEDSDDDSSDNINMDDDSNNNNNNNGINLQVPVMPKLAALSPPASPPVGWVTKPEPPPTVNPHIIEALRVLGRGNNKDANSDRVVLLDSTSQSGLQQRVSLPCIHLVAANADGEDDVPNPYIGRQGPSISFNIPKKESERKFPKATFAKDGTVGQRMKY